MTTTSELAERYRAVFPSWLGPLHGTAPISLDHGDGSYVWDLEGNRYLDAFGGVLTTMIGHNHPEVTASLQAQAAKVIHSSTLYLNEEMIASGRGDRRSLRHSGCACLLHRFGKRSQ